MNAQGKVGFSGSLAIKVIRCPRPSLIWRLKNFFRVPYLHGLLAVKVGVPIARLFGLMTAYGTLEAVLIKADGTRINYGVLGHRVVTTAFVTFLTDQLQTETSVFGDFKYHDSGVGTTAENVADIAMQTTDGEARVAGSQTESSANVYVSVGTITYSTTKAITEHGLFNDLTAGTLLDRTVFAAVNVGAGDAIQFTYSLTSAAGS